MRSGGYGGASSGSSGLGGSSSFGRAGSDRYTAGAPGCSNAPAEAAHARSDGSRHGRRWRASLMQQPCVLPSWHSVAGTSGSLYGASSGGLGGASGGLAGGGALGGGGYTASRRWVSGWPGEGRSRPSVTLHASIWMLPFGFFHTPARRASSTRCCGTAYRALLVAQTPHSTPRPSWLPFFFPQQDRQLRRDGARFPLHLQAAARRLQQRR